MSSCCCRSERLYSRFWKLVFHFLLGVSENSNEEIRTMIVAQFTYKSWQSELGVVSGFRLHSRPIRHCGGEKRSSVSCSFLMSPLQTSVATEVEISSIFMAAAGRQSRLGHRRRGKRRILTSHSWCYHVNSMTPPTLWCLVKFKVKIWVRIRGELVVCNPFYLFIYLFYWVHKSSAISWSFLTPLCTAVHNWFKGRLMP